MNVQVPLAERSEPNPAGVRRRIREAAGSRFDVSRFIDNFDVLVEAPAGLIRLRELILELAIRGMLCDQHASDEPADVLLARIREAQVRAEKANEIDRVSPSAPIELEEHRYQLPQGWAWTRLQACVLTIQIGPFGSLLHQSDYVSGGTPLVNPAHIKNGRIVPEDKKGVASKTLQRLAGYRLRAADVVMGRRGEMGKCAVVTATESGWLCGTGSLFVRPTSDVLPAFLATWLRSPLVRRRLEGESVGSTMNNLNLRILNNLVLGLPPLAEQQRIVARVHELTQMLDDLESKQTKRDATQVRLRSAALGALTDAEGSDDFKNSWKRIEENFEILFDGAESIAELRMLLTELAATGRLVAADDRSVSKVSDVLLNRADTDSRLASRLEDLPAPYEKHGWLHVPLGHVLREPLANGRSVPDDPKGFPVLRLSALRGRFVDFAEQKLGAWTAEDAAAFVVKAGDILFVRGNGALRLVGRACMAKTSPSPVAFPDTAIRARLRPKVVTPEWLWYVWESRFVRRQVEALAKTTAGIFKVSQEDLYKVQIPVPTLDEQQRIVAWVDQLMKVCDDLETKLKGAQSTASKLVDAMVAELVT